MGSTASDTAARISIVLPTYNRQASLRRCLEALLRCDAAGLDVEVQVVDDGSSDGTEDMVSGLAAACDGSIRLRYHRQENAGSGAARNLGIRKSDAEIVLFIDDDCAPEAGWLQALVRGPWGSGVGAVGGKIESGEDSTWVSRYCRHIRFDEYPKYRKDGALTHVNTANCAYRRQVLTEVGGLEPSLCGGGVDIDLAQRVVAQGYRLEYQPEAVVRHYHRETVRMLVRTFLKRGERGYLRSMLWEERDHPTRGKQVKEIYRLVFSLFQLPLLPFEAARLARAGVNTADAVPFAFMDWLRVQAFRCGKVRMMGHILSGRQRLERTSGAEPRGEPLVAREPAARAGAEGGPA